jgi:subfamily B ATP-binding cassette protein MsbA
MQRTSTYAILSPSFRNYWGLIAVTVLFSLLSAVFEGISIGLIIPFLQTFSDDVQAFSTGVGWIDVYLLGTESSKLSQLARICGFILVATWCRSLFGYLSGVYATTSRVRIVEHLRMRVVDQLQSVALRFFSKTRGGEILNTITNEIGRSTIAVGVIFSSVLQSALLLIYLSLIFWISWELSLLVLVFFGALSLALSNVVKSVRTQGEMVTKASGRFTSAITELINGIRTITLYNQQPYEHDRLEAATQTLATKTLDTAKRSLLVRPASQAIVSTVLMVILFLAVWLYVLPGVLDIAFLLTFLFALFRMMPCVDNLNSQRGEWARSRAGLENIADLLRREDKPYLEEGSRPAPPLQDAIVFDGVDFAYEPGSLVLQNIHARIETGKMTALVGSSGAGKSTLADLIPRLADPVAGRVLYDGVDLRTFDVRSLRDRIAVVSQSTYIFNDTVANNIAYGAPDASMADILRAAEQANAIGFIEEMEHGMDTSLGDRGVRLSGGQRQRIAIARAILRDPDILILDEATSALDSLSERLVQQSIERLMGGRTVIAIAHRLSTIENADWVIVLEAGRIVEQGPYDALLEQRGHLWNYHSIQSQPA